MRRCDGRERHCYFDKRGYSYTHTHTASLTDALTHTASLTDALTHTASLTDTDGGDFKEVFSFLIAIYFFYFFSFKNGDYLLKILLLNLL